ncbi:MAG: DUF5615 family PIN-like protein [Bryobacteraceae bacterium]
MKIKLDENLPTVLVSHLRRLGHDVDTVASENLTGSDDDRVWHAAQADQRFLITQDLDFSDVRRFKPGTHWGILIVRLTNPSRMALASHLVTLFSHESVEQWQGCVLILTDHKLRIRRPV